MNESDSRGESRYCPRCGMPLADPAHEVLPNGCRYSWSSQPRGESAKQEAQEIHEERQREDPQHDRVGCWCCCVDCGFDYDEVEGGG